MTRTPPTPHFHVFLTVGATLRCSCGLVKFVDLLSRTLTLRVEKEG